MIGKAYEKGDVFDISPLTKRPFFELRPDMCDKWQENPTKNAQRAADVYLKNKKKPSLWQILKEHFRGEK